MNVFKKIYCRVFQFCFKIAIPFLPYKNPQILNDIDSIAPLLKEKGYTKVIVITDKIISGLSSFEKLVKSLEKNQVKYTIYDKTVPNPTIRNVEEAREEYLKEGCEAIIAMGGGSAIDCGKALGARIAKKNKPVHKMAGILQIRKKTPFFVAVPTTAGTGSEVTVTCVITDEKTHHKTPISDFCLIPDVAVLDSITTKTLPKSIIATTGMDALTHAVEAYVGNSTTKSTRSDAIEALRLIFENLYCAYQNNDDDSIRYNMLYASFLAGRAFSKSYVGYCHAVAHSLGGEYNIPHGLANAVLLPYVLEEYGNAVHKKLKKLAVILKLCPQTVTDSEGAEVFIEKIKDMNKSMDIPKKIKGIKKEDVPRIAKYAHKEANPLYPVPRLMDAGELETLYYKVMEA